MNKCFKEYASDNKDTIEQKVGFCSRDNANAKNLNQAGGNLLNDTDYFLPFTGISTNEKVVKTTDLKAGVNIIGDREFYFQGSENFAGQNQYSYRYSFNLPQAEWMAVNPTDKTYKWAVKEANLKPSGQPFDQYVAYFMHTFWVSNSGTFARWYEWSFTIRTYTVIDQKDIKTDDANVFPYRIPGPPCENCVATIKHSAEMLFFEERDTTQAGFPDQIEPANMKYAADCQWDTPRGDLAFQALNLGVCIGIRLKDKTTKRKFQLERLLYGYKGADGINHPADKFHLYDKVKPNAPPANAAIKYFKWDNVNKLLGIRFDILATGQLERLQYSAQVRLCELEDPYVENQCIVTRAGENKAEFTDINFSRLRDRVLADGTVERVLSNEKKQVVATYQSEQTYTGKSGKLRTVPDAAGGSTTTGGNGGAVVGAVVGLGVVGGIGLAGWMYYAKKGCFAAKNAAGNIPTGTNPANANMQGTTA